MPFNSLMVTLSEDTPVAVERIWDVAAFAERDARLAALGVRPFGTRVLTRHDLTGAASERATRGQE